MVIIWRISDSDFIVEDVEVEVGDGEEDVCGLGEVDDDGVEEVDYDDKSGVDFGVMGYKFHQLMNNGCDLKQMHHHSF